MQTSYGRHDHEDGTAIVLAYVHLRVSTRNRATLQFSCVAASAISMHSLKNLSACASRARAYLSMLRAIMDISARAISLADRPQAAIWVTSARMRREDRSSISFLVLSQTSAGKG
jgi:hypothetical protein